MTDEKTLKYLENAGYIQVHQDRAALAGLMSYKDSFSGYYVGLGLMKLWTSGPQILAVRSLLGPSQRRGFDAAVSFWTGRVGSAVKVPVETVFGIDEGDVEKAQGVTDKLADGDYGGAAEDAGGDIAKGAAIGASIAAATAAGGSIAVAATATGAAIGTAIPIPVIGTAAGAAIGATVAAAIILGNIVFGSKPAFDEGDYTRMKNRQKESGAVEQVGGVPPDLYGACKYADGSVSGGDWPFPGTWNHEIRDQAAYQRNWAKLCESLGGSAWYPEPGARGQCRFPDGYSTDGGEFYKPIWPADKQAAYMADQAARKIQMDNLGSYVNGLKAIDAMVKQADTEVRKSNSIPARNVWLGKIGDAFAKIYIATGQDKYAPLNVQGFIADTQKRIYSPPAPKVALLPPPPKGSADERNLSSAKANSAMKRLTMIKALKPGEQLAIGAQIPYLSKSDQEILAKNGIYAPGKGPVADTPTAPPPAVTPAQYAGQMITQGAVAAAPDHRVALTAPIVENPATKPGVIQAVENVQLAKKTIMRKVLEFFHILPKG